MKKNNNNTIEITRQFLKRLSFELELNEVFVENGFKNCSHALKIGGECVQCKGRI